MAEKTAPMKEEFKTVQDLENQCNFIEKKVRGKIKSVKAVGKAADHVTEALFEISSDAPLGPGNMKFKLDNGGTNTAWISGVIAKVSFTRPA